MLNGLHGLDIAFLFISLVVGITFHEMMHGRVAYWLGDTTAADMGRLTLNPLASIDPFYTIVMPLLLLVTLHVPFFAAKPVPFNPSRVRWDEWGAALVGIAGPITNFVLAVLGAIIFRLVVHTGGNLVTFWYYFVLVNVGLMVFNMIPFPPLDGSRVVYAVAPEPVRDVMARIEGLGFTAILLFILVIFQFIAPIVSTIDSTIIRWLIGV
ncbi:MAG TPA: site-2 protease family protein [Candidatus Saccharimonadales bacterium]|nr:site-2 protease family protein [Candidatus Saccharimonadales bacterium]